jgi:hypothetical protein
MTRAGAFPPSLQQVATALLLLVQNRAGRVSFFLDVSPASVRVARTDRTAARKRADPEECHEWPSTPVIRVS